MIMSKYEARINRVESAVNMSPDMSLSINLINRGAYYDELTEAEKDAYIRYLGFDDREVWESVERTVLESLGEFDESFLHFRLTPKPKPPTAEEHRRNVAEVEQFVNTAIDEYNSPEAVELQKQNEEKFREENRRKFLHLKTP